MDEARLIDARALKQLLEMGMNLGHIQTMQDVEDYIDVSPTIDPESPWREANCEPPTHVDEWDDGRKHYRMKISDNLWLYCADGTQLVGRYENGAWVDDCGCFISQTEHIRCTHWMPYPKAPKGVA